MGNTNENYLSFDYELSRGLLHIKRIEFILGRFPIFFFTI